MGLFVSYKRQKAMGIRGTSSRSLIFETCWYPDPSLDGIVVSLSGNPAPNMLAVAPKLVTIFVAKPVFLISDNNHIRDDKTNARVRNQNSRPEKPGLRQENEYHTNIHRISDVAI